MKAAWEIFDYECGQLDELRKAFHAGFLNAQPLHVRNAMVKSAIIHLRIVLEMLRDKPQQPGDYCLTDLIVISDKPPGLPALMNFYTHGPTYSALVEVHLAGDPALIAPNLKRSPKDQINKLMFHPTRSRTTSHDWTPILNIIAPHLDPVIAHLKRHAIR